MLISKYLGVVRMRHCERCALPAELLPQYSDYLCFSEVVKVGSRSISVNNYLGIPPNVRQ